MSPYLTLQRVPLHGPLAVLPKLVGKQLYPPILWHVVLVIADDDEQTKKRDVGVDFSPRSEGLADALRALSLQRIDVRLPSLSAPQPSRNPSPQSS